MNIQALMRDPNFRAQMQALARRVQKRREMEQKKQLLTSVMGGKGGSELLENAYGLATGGGAADTLAAGGQYLAPGGGPLMQNMSLPLLERTPANLFGAYTPQFGLAGAALGGYGVYDAIKGDKGFGSGALAGAGMGSGLAMAAPLVGLGPVGWGGLALAAGLGALGGGGLAEGFGHKSTKQYAKERTDKLMKQDWGSSGEQVAKLRDKSGNNDALWKKWMADPEKRKEVLSDPVGNWGALGMLETFGPDYFNKMNEHQRYAATKYAIDNNMFVDDKGDRLIRDKDKLRAAVDEFTNNQDYKNAYNEWKKNEAGYNEQQLNSILKESNELVNKPKGESLIDKKKQLSAEQVAASGVKTPGASSNSLEKIASEMGVTGDAQNLILYLDEEERKKLGQSLGQGIQSLAGGSSTPARSRTLSPGIGLDGKRISY